MGEAQIGVIHEIGDTGGEFYPLNEAEQELVSKENEQKKENK